MSSNYHAGLLSSLPLIHQGKVRDCFAIDDAHMLMVASDRLSAFDVVLPDPIPGKGEMLTRLSNFWFELTADIVPNHVSNVSIHDVIDDPDLAKMLAPRSMVVRRLQPLPVEAIVRGYLIGSGWKDYQESGMVCGIPLPRGLRLADRLPEVLFTPSTKAQIGDHDVNIDFASLANAIGSVMAERVKQASLDVFRAAGRHASDRGVIIADTKFEFGLDENDNLVLMDEVLTPDSSRFWPADAYRPGVSPPSYDKQFVRDYLETLDWDKTPPGPRLPQDVIDATGEKYREVCSILIEA